MGLNKHKPVTPSERFTVLSDFQELSQGNKPQRSLLKAKKRCSGRNSAGRITVRHRGGGHKKRYRVIDFKRVQHKFEAKVASIEYDPNRTANIALLHYLNGEKAYIIAPHGLKVGDRVRSGPDAEPELGNALPVGKIPLGTTIHNIELVPGRGATIVRSAGTGAILQSRDGEFATIKFPSGEIRKINVRCQATIGRVGNSDHGSQNLGKAGRARWKGRRPTVRGVAMNPVDHPMGGGEGRTSGGSHPVSPWGQLAKGKKTRSRRKASSKYIVKRRNQK